MEERVAVLSGGGSHGAYHLGVLEYSMARLGRRYTRFYGVSAGALIAGYMCMASIDEQLDALICLKRLWCNLRTKDIYKKRTGGILAGLMGKSVYNSWPLVRLVQGMWDRDKALASGVLAKVGAVCWDTGEYRVVSSRVKYFDYWICASASYPVFMLPVKIGDAYWGDGGMANITPVKAALLDGCKRIDVISCEPTGAVDRWAPVGEQAVPGFLFRMLSITMREIADTDLQVVGHANDLVQLKDAYTDVDLRVLRPEYPLRGGSLEFVPAASSVNCCRGFQDALCASAQGRW